MASSSWLVKFCTDVFVDEVRARTAAGLVRGGVDGFSARHREPVSDADEKRLLEAAIWFVWDTKLLDADNGVEDKRVAILERLEFIRGVRPE